jgi:hypothetical protein
MVENLMGGRHIRSQWPSCRIGCCIQGWACRADREARQQENRLGGPKHIPCAYDRFAGPRISTPSRGYQSSPTNLSMVKGALPS